MLEVIWQKEGNIKAKAEKEIVGRKITEDFSVLAERQSKGACHGHDSTTRMARDSSDFPKGVLPVRCQFDVDRKCFMFNKEKVEKHLCISSRMFWNALNFLTSKASHVLFSLFA